MGHLSRHAPADTPTPAGRWQAAAVRLVLPALAAASAVVWAFGVTVLQPLSEPAGPDAYGENNTYWARELRWGALIALVVVLVALARGSRPATGGVLACGIAWLAADIALDRFGPPAGTAQLATAAAGAAALCAAVAGAVPAVPRPQWLFGAASVAAVAAGLATAVESPTDVEPALAAGSATAGSLLALAAVAAAVHAAGPVSAARIPTAVLVGVLAAAAPWPLRYLSPQPSGARTLAVLAFTVLLVAGVFAVARPDPDSRQARFTHGVVAAVAAVVLPLVFLPLMLMSIVLGSGDVFTWLAANPPVDDADEDVVLIVLAVPAGLVLARLLQALLPPRQ